MISCHHCVIKSIIYCFELLLFYIKNVHFLFGSLFSQRNIIPLTLYTHIYIYIYIQIYTNIQTYIFITAHSPLTPVDTMSTVVSVGRKRASRHPSDEGDDEPSKEDIYSSPSTDDDLGDGDGDGDDDDPSLTSPELGQG